MRLTTSSLSRLLCVGALVLAAACTGSDGPFADEFADGGLVEGDDGFALDPTRNDVDCSEDSIGSTPETEFTVAHFVVDGSLGDVCWGERDTTLLDAWEILEAITPRGQLGDLGLFGGFVGPDVDDNTETTLAFVNAVDDEGDLFQMSINLTSFVADPDEAALTIAHEFSHVFTAIPSELDRSDEASDECDTYLTAEGCYADDAVMFGWIEEFWGEWIDDVDPEDEATVESGEQRCAVDPSFFGPYAASNPEEDFAEAFSAYVFDVEPHTDAQFDKLDWIDARPGLAEFRDRARAAELGPLPNNFEPCG